MYLDIAKWGIETLTAGKLMGKPFRFQIVGILASLRAVQHALLNHDSKLSEKHTELIEAWKKNTPMDGPEITFIKTSRDAILKAGDFDAYAISTESSIGEYSNREITREDYETAYYKGGERRDLLADMQAAVKWCENQLQAISAQLPKMYAPE